MGDCRYDLAGEDLTALLAISQELRTATRGRYERKNLANEITRLGGLKSHASIRALVSMDDLRLMAPATLEGLAIGAGIPASAAAWIATIESLRSARDRRVARR